MIKSKNRLSRILEVFSMQPPAVNFKLAPGSFHPELRKEFVCVMLSWKGGCCCCSCPTVSFGASRPILLFSIFLHLSVPFSSRRSGGWKRCCRHCADICHRAFHVQNELSSVGLGLWHTCLVQCPFAREVRSPSYTCSRPCTMLSSFMMFL